MVDSRPAKKDFLKMNSPSCIFKIQYFINYPTIGGVTKFVSQITMTKRLFWA